MALEKQIKVDKIEVVGDFKAVQVRTATCIMDDGVEISRSFHRHVVTAGRTTAMRQQKYRLSVQHCTHLKSSPPMKHIQPPISLESNL